MKMAIVLALATAMTVQAQQPPLPISDGQVIPLWSGAAPGVLGSDESDIPAVTVYLPRQMTARTPAMIVCPGGGYRALASNHEGMGFSAGGHLAMGASTLFDPGNPRSNDIVDRSGSRPDIAVLGYPVISMTAPWTHPGSKSNLLGNDADPGLARRLSGEHSVTRDTPPTFVFQTNEDATVAAENSLHYFLALRQAGVPAEMHIFEKGRHGVGLANDDPALAPWSTLLANWLRVRAFIK